MRSRTSSPIFLAALLVGCGSGSGTGAVDAGQVDARPPSRDASSGSADARPKSRDARSDASDAGTRASDASDGGYVLLFGGSGPCTNCAGVLDDTWTWDGATWTQHNTSGPSARRGASLATVGGTAVLFAGEPVAYPWIVADLNDTWTWDGAKWAQLDVAGPGVRCFASASTLNGLVVLFGGLNHDPVGTNDELVSLNDTWTWNGLGWTVQTPPVLPGVRSKAGTATLGDAVVLFGGAVANDGMWVVLSDTWTWNGTGWTQQNVVGPSARGTAMATLHDTVVLFGGFYDSTYPIDSLGDTWTWDGSTWTEQNVPGPSPRAGHAMATLNDTVVLFGGVDLNGGALADTWTWDGHAWTQHDVVGPSPRSDTAMTGL
jgi:N-acetylneuraminic acid mutarotase